MHSRAKITGIGTALLLALAGVAPATAEPLPQDKCAALATEQLTLVAGGVKDDFAKGAEWGRANLKTARLKEIERYIEVEEQLGFRCGLARARFTLPPDEDSQAAAAAAAAASAQPDAPKEEPKASPKPKAKPKAVEKAADDAPDKAAAEPRTTPAPKLQAKPSPKPDDAYRPVAPVAAPKQE